MPWIELHQNILRHPKLVRLSVRLAIKKQDALWHLLSLWLWALDYAQKGDLSGFGPAEIAEAAEWRGDAELFISAMQDAKWLDGMSLHDWMDYAGRLVEQREANKERMRVKRAPHVQRTTDERVALVGGLPNQPTNQPDQTVPTTQEPYAFTPGLDAKAKEVMDAYPKYSKDGRQVQGFTLQSQSQTMAAIKRAPDFPWVEAAGLEKQNDYPTDFGKWLAMMPDPVWLEAKRGAPPKPKQDGPLPKKKWKQLG